MGDAGEFAELVGLVYDAALEPALWPRALEQLSDAVRGGPAVLIRPSEGFGPGAMLSVRLDPSINLFYAEHIRDADVLVRATGALPTGTVTTDRMLVPVDEFRRTDYYRDFLASLDIETSLGATLATGARSACAVARSRRQGEWEREQIDLLRRLTPHLRRAVEIGRRLDGAGVRQVGVELLDRLPHAVILVDGSGHAVFANRAAQILLADGSAIRVATGAIAAATDEASARLRRAVGRAARGRTDTIGSAVALPAASGQALLAFVAPVGADFDWPFRRRPAAAILIADPAGEAVTSVPAADHGEAHRGGGLAPRERECLAMVAGGKSSKAIAIKLSLSPHTVDQYIESAMRKLLSTSRAEAVATAVALGLFAA